MERKTAIRIKGLKKRYRLGQMDTGSVGKKELESMIREGKPIEVNCHFCNSHYHFTVDDLKEMLKSAR